jgi:hypothetical protein
MSMHATIVVRKVEPWAAIAKDGIDSKYSTELKTPRKFNFMI